MKNSRFPSIFTPSSQGRAVLYPPRHKAALRADPGALSSKALRLLRPATANSATSLLP